MSPPTREGPEPEAPGAPQIHRQADHPEAYSTGVNLFGEPDPTPIVQCARCGGRIFGPGQQAGDRHSWCVERDAGVYSPPTSHRAARTPRKPGRLDALVLGVLERAGASGRTDDEIAERLPAEHPGSVSKARLRLVRLGLAVDSGRTRPTSRGVDAIVWLIVDGAR